MVLASGTDGQDNALSGANGKGILLGQKGDVEADSLLIRGAAMFQELDCKQDIRAGWGSVFLI